MAFALVIAALLGGGTYMVLRRGMLRILVGFVLISHGVNLLIIFSGGTTRRTPAIGSILNPLSVADPLPQALVLTAVVISFAVTVFLLTLSVVGDGDDDTELDLSEGGFEKPDLIEEEDDLVRRPHRRYPASNWHGYLDRADDISDDDALDFDAEYHHIHDGHHHDHAEEGYR